MLYKGIILIALFAINEYATAYPQAVFLSLRVVQSLAHGLGQLHAVNILSRIADHLNADLSMTIGNNLLVRCMTASLLKSISRITAPALSDVFAITYNNPCFLAAFSILF